MHCSSCFNAISNTGLVNSIAERFYVDIFRKFKLISSKNHLVSAENLYFDLIIILNNNKISTLWQSCIRRSVSELFKRQPCNKFDIPCPVKLVTSASIQTCWILGRSSADATCWQICYSLLVKFLFVYLWYILIK